MVKSLALPAATSLTGLLAGPALAQWQVVDTIDWLLGRGKRRVRG